MEEAGVLRMDDICSKAYLDLRDFCLESYRSAEFSEGVSVIRNIEVDRYCHLWRIHGASASDWAWGLTC